MTSKELAKKASDALKSLGNVCRKDLEKSATKDIFVVGKVVLRQSLAKKHPKALKKISWKGELIFQSIDSFQSEIGKRRKDNSYDYQQSECSFKK